MKLIDLTGKRINHLTVIRPDRTEGNSVKWVCKCDCGTVKTFSGAGLRSGKTKDCGCSKSETARKKFTKHGDSYTRLHGVWREMRDRCRNPRNKNYGLYGARGIRVCEAWDDFIKFRDWARKSGYDDAKDFKSQTVDRIDPNKGYCPENCRIVDMITQGNNRRNNVILEYNGQKHTISEWGRISGVGEKTLHSRIERGWEVARAIETPPRKKS